MLSNKHRFLMFSLSIAVRGNSINAMDNDVNLASQNNITKQNNNLNIINNNGNNASNNSGINSLELSDIFLE